MTNQDIDLFFEKVGLSAHVEKQSQEPSCVWTLNVGAFPVLIQTQASANRMRIVAYIAEQSDIDPEQLVDMLEANYHSALDARYALADGYVVAAFLHPFKELDGNQFVLGMYQVISCAETFGSYYSGGTMVFGGQSAPKNTDESDLDTDSIGDMENGAVSFLSDLVQKIQEN